MMSGARSRGLNPRKSASPCSVTTISRSCSNQGRQPSVTSEHEAKKKKNTDVKYAPVWSTWLAKGTIQLMPVGSVLLGRALGVCMIESFAFLKKSAEPPIPLSMRDPRALVELAWAYLSRRRDQCWTVVERGKRTMSTSNGVFMAIIPKRLIISGELATCCERRRSLSL